MKQTLKQRKEKAMDDMYSIGRQNGYFVMVLVNVWLIVGFFVDSWTPIILAGLWIIFLILKERDVDKAIKEIEGWKR